MLAEEEKREARAKKEEERARKLEERRLRDEEKQRARDQKVKAKASAQTPKEEANEEPVVSDEEPPVLEPIPHVASIAPTEKPQVATDETKAKTLPGNENAIDPTLLPASDSDKTTVSQADQVSIESKKTELEPMVTAETGLHKTGSGLSGDAEAIGRRVFSAPVENETTPASALEPTASETEELAQATSNVEEAPVVKADITTAPAAGTTTANTAPAESKTAQPETTQATTVTSPADDSTKHDVPVVSRIAPPIAAVNPPVATTETTVSGPSTSPKSKESKGVSSWLKKLRRSSKATKPDNAASTPDTKEKGFVGGANLTAPKASNPSSDRGDSSMRDVAIAGKEPTTDPGATTTTAPALTPIVSPNDEDLYSASTHSNKAPGAIQRQSTSSPSISSLSSDEDNRGRSAIPRDREPLNQAEFVQAELQSGEHVDPALVAGEQVDPALIKQGGSQNEGSAEHFEEARDAFDSEKLSPPERGVVGRVGRSNDSPARDSKFLENL